MHKAEYYEGFLSYIKNTISESEGRREEKGIHEVISFSESPEYVPIPPVIIPAEKPFFGEVYDK
jgi:hypothetical protein